MATQRSRGPGGQGARGTSGSKGKRGQGKGGPSKSSQGEGRPAKGSQGKSSSESLAKARPARPGARPAQPKSAASPERSGHVPGPATGRINMTGRAGSSSPSKTHPRTRGSSSTNEKPADARIEYVDSKAAGGGRPPRMLSFRAIILGAVVLTAFIVLFPTLNRFLSQNQALAELSAQVETAEQRNIELQAELDRWSDPAFVQAQARERLSFVMPGETPYKVIEPEATAKDPDAQPGAEPDATPVSPTWYQTIWSSVEIAGKAATP